MSATMKDIVTPFARQRSGERTNNGGAREKPPRSRGPPQNVGEESTELEEEEEEQTKTWTKKRRTCSELTVQLESRMSDMESATYCTLFLLRDRAIETDMQDAGRAYNDKVVICPDEERGVRTSGTSWRS